MLESDVTEPTSLEWGFPVVLVPKKDGTLQFCVHYRLLNGVSKKDSDLLPRMDEYIDSRRESNVISTLDSNAGYWEVMIAAEDQEKTFFVWHSGTFHSKWMPLGGYIRQPLSSGRSSSSCRASSGRAAWNTWTNLSSTPSPKRNTSTTWIGSWDDCELRE